MSTPTAVRRWSPYERDHRSYLTIGIGCTGGQHRSVFVAETARKLLADVGIEARCRHREAARWTASHAPEIARSTLESRMKP